MYTRQFRHRKHCALVDSCSSHDQAAGSPAYVEGPRPSSRPSGTGKRALVNEELKIRQPTTIDMISSLSIEGPRGLFPACKATTEVSNCANDLGFVVEHFDATTSSAPVSNQACEVRICVRRNSSVCRHLKEGLLLVNSKAGNLSRGGHLHPEHRIRPPDQANEKQRGTQHDATKVTQHVMVHVCGDHLSGGYAVPVRDDPLFSLEEYVVSRRATQLSFPVDRVRASCLAGTLKKQ